MRRKMAAVVVAVTALVAACGPAKSSKSGGNSTGTATTTATASGAGTDVGGKDGGTGKAGSGLALRSLVYGGYFGDNDPGPFKSVFGVEYGFLDLRQNHHTSALGINDFRWTSASALTDKAEFAGAVALNTCRVISAVKGAANGVESVQLSGAVSAKVSAADDGIFRYDDLDGKKKIDTAQKLAAKFTGAGAKELAALETAALPDTGSIQLSGAFDTNLTVNTALSDLNEALQDAKDPLVVTDVGSAKNYNVLVVTLYGGAASGSKRLRCAIGKGGSATLERKAYAALLPLKGLVGVFANVTATLEGDVLRWTSAYSGQGAEDFAVP